MDEIGEAVIALSRDKIPTQPVHSFRSTAAGSTVFLPAVTKAEYELSESGEKKTRKLRSVSVVLCEQPRPTETGGYRFKIMEALERHREEVFKPTRRLLQKAAGKSGSDFPWEDLKELFKTLQSVNSLMNQFDVVSDALTKGFSPEDKESIANANDERIKSIHALPIILEREDDVKLEKELRHLEDVVRKMWKIVAESYANTIATMEPIFPAE